MKSSKSGLFLLELIIAVLFFSIASTACIQLFAKAHTLDIKTGAQNQTIIWSQNLAELWRVSSGDLNFIDEQLKQDYLYPQGSVICDITKTDGTGELYLYFDKDWNFAPSNPTYFVILHTDGTPDADGLLHADIRFYEDEITATPFYELSLLLHLAEKEVDSHE